MFQINKKLIFISIIFMITFMLASLFLVNTIFDSGSKLTTNVHLNQIIYNLEKEINLLKSTTEKIADNKKIIQILDENRTFIELDNEEKDIIMDQINLYEQNLKAAKFVDTVNIVSLSGNYLFSKGKIYDNFKLSDRPWFKEEYLCSDENSYISEMHEDFSTSKNTIAIVSFIYSKDNKELLGAAVLDIFVEDLLEDLESSFSFGTLKAFITKKDNIPNILEERNTNKYYIKYEENKDSSNGILFMFNKESIKESSSVKPILISTRVIIFIVGLIISISLIISIRVAFRPALQSIYKLRNLLGDLSNDGEINSLEKMDEFKQLEVISMGLGKSFDNRIQSLIYHDSLTGLANRKKLNIICKELIEKESEFALIFIDLNKFKKVNDRFGHSVGDQLLITFSNIMTNILGESGELIRYSGDEFIIIFKDFKSDESFKSYYENNILPSFENPIEIEEGIKIKIEFSTGIAVFSRDGVELEDLINKSDFMMYASKNDPTPYKLLFFNDDIYKDMMYIETLKNELKNSVKDNELILNYQPICDRNKNIVKIEALVRWNNKNLGMIRPDKFINYAEETRDIIPIGYWIIEKVCKFIKQNNLIVPIGINISPIQLLEDDFVTNVDIILNKYKINSKQIYFEVTESVLLEDNDVVKSNILRLRELGIFIALDDFGTGYASFSYLKKYKLDILKIDKLFIDEITSKEIEIISCLKRISNLLNMKVVIEGVETEEQFIKLKNIGCNFFQGYYFSKPLKESEILEIL